MFRKGRWLIPFVLLLWGLSCFVVREGNPELSAVGLERHWKGRPWTGVIIDFHKNGWPALFATYLHGQQHGWSITWYPDGQREREQGFRHGLYHGVSQSWHPTGRIKTWRSYVNGLADGEQWAWGPDGQVQEYNLYQLDQELAHKTWTFDGKPFHNYVYQNGEKVGIMGEPFCKRKKQL
jgi:antitoxin component YwqK of YwqJK toxin-antitoxin module